MNAGLEDQTVASCRSADLWLPSRDLCKRTIVGNVFLISMTGSRLLELRGSAETIWDLLHLDEPRSEASLLSQLALRFPTIPLGELRADLYGFLLDLHCRGFVRHPTDEEVLLPSQDQKLPAGRIQIGAHSAFLERMHESADSHGIPISGALELTQHCHLKCRHCYIDGRPTCSGLDLTTTEIVCILDDLAHAGCLWLLLTGGEPLLRRDFPVIYRHAKRLGMIVTLFTSATNLSDSIADLLAEYPPLLVEATLHAASAAPFDAITGVPGSFERFCEGVERMRVRGIMFHLKTIVMKENVGEIESARRLAANLGADDYRIDTMVNTDFRHTGKAKELRISVEDALRLDAQPHLKERWLRVFQDAALHRPTANRSELLLPCRAGKCSFTISADGFLMACVLMRKPAIDLRRTSVAAAWTELRQFAIATPMSDGNPCRRCEVETCPRCPAWGQLEHGDPNAKSSFACALQRERERVFLPRSQPKEKATK